MGMRVITFVAGCLVCSSALADKPAPSDCARVVAHVLAFETRSSDANGDAEAARNFREHRRKTLSAACTERPWSATFRLCVLSTRDGDAIEECSAAEYERSPRRARCDAVTAAIEARTEAELRAESESAARAFRESSRERLPREKIQCAVGPWSDADLTCLEAARTVTAGQECVARHLWKRKKKRAANP